MHSEREQSWRVLVTAKANKFNFRLRFTAATPTHKPTSNFSFSFFRLSILLNLPKFALSINSHPTQPTRFIKFLHRFRPPLLKKKEPNAPHRKDLIRIIGFWVVGLLSCLALSVFMNGQRGIVMLSYVGSLLLLFRKLKMAKVMNLVRFLLMAVVTISCYLFFNFDFDYNYWEFVGRRSWNKMVNL